VSALCIVKEEECWCVYTYMGLILRFQDVEDSFSGQVIKV